MVRVDFFLDETYKTKVGLFRRGAGEDLIFEIRESYYAQDELIGYSVELVTPKAPTVDKLKKLLLDMLECLDQPPIVARHKVDLPWGKH